MYCRKSSEAEDRQILSIDSQVGELKRYAASRKLKILAVLTEAKSAKAPGQRPVFNSMMQRLYRGEAGSRNNDIKRNIDAASIVRLAIDGARTVDDLRVLADRGVDVMACGTCLGYFDLTDRLAAGRITNMYDIAQVLLDAGKVVHV